MEEYQKTHIIIHHSLGEDGITRNWDDITRDHIENRGFRAVGYHYGVELVGNKHEIQKGREELDVGAHCKEGGMNYLGLGVCLVGNFDKAEPPEDQLKLAAELCADLCQRHRIPIDNIEPHRRYAINSMTGLPYKSCPGNKFNMEKFKGRVQAILSPEKKGEPHMFQDVNPEKWYAEVVEEAAKLGLMMGTAPGKFDPDAPLTRAMGAAIAVRLYKATNEDFVEVINKVLPAVVQVENFELGGLGSGTIIHPAGYVLTNCHVVSKITKISDTEEQFEVAKTVAFRSTTAPWSYAEGEVIAHNREIDLALCKIGLSDPFPVLPLGKHWLIGQAQKVLAIGSPLGLIQSVAEGVISSIRINPWGSKATFLQTEAAINPGNSGGALVNLSGELIGVPSMKLVDVAVEGLGFAIALPTILSFLKGIAPAEVLSYLGLGG